MMDAASAVKIMYADEIESGDATEVIAEKTAEYAESSGQCNVSSCKRIC